MPVKNASKYLRDCLDSILAQSYVDWELVAVNDYSTDHSAEILREYAMRDHRIRVFDSVRPSLVPTLQKAYKESRGTLINRMDADDKMPAYKLELLATEWGKHGKGFVIAGGTKHFVDIGNVGEGFLRYDRWLNDIAKRATYYEEIYQECVIPSQCWLVHRDDFDAVGAFDSEVYPEDYDLCFRFYRKKLKVIGIDKVLHHWRDHANRISRTWDCYKDNRYFELKLRYFYELDRDRKRPLVLWGAGKNGKNMAQLLQANNDDFHWVCDNPNKVGREIYGIYLEHFDDISILNNPQIMVVVSSPDGKKEIRKQLVKWHKKPTEDFWFFN